MTDPSAQLGEVDFPVSCTPEAQAAFGHGMALLHSFEYAAAIESFNTATELDPSCAMANWGVAMSLVEPLWGNPLAQMSGGRLGGCRKGHGRGCKDPARAGLY